MAAASDGRRGPPASGSRGWGSFPVYLRRAAVGETLAHLVLLESEGRVVQRGSPALWSRT